MTFTPVIVHGRARGIYFTMAMNHCNSDDIKCSRKMSIFCITGGTRQEGCRHKLKNDFLQLKHVQTFHEKYEIMCKVKIELAIN